MCELYRWLFPRERIIVFFRAFTKSSLVGLSGKGRSALNQVIIDLKGWKGPIDRGSLALSEVCV